VILRLYPPWALPGLVRRARLRARLEFPIPTGSYHVVELHVAPDLRGGGIGSALLRHAEGLARERGCARINLTTSITNPALRLYLRHGYLETGRLTAPGYEALAGTPGRVFLEKRLAE
jgi:ribosomal protein S18 acetylase RimI-like enzyme